MAKVMDSNTKFAHLGKPGSIFSAGFERRFQKLLKVVDLKDKVILDQGCGEGVWMHRFTDFTSPQNVFGEDIDPESISKFESFNSKFEKGKQIPSENLKICPAEALDFPDEKFDIVFSNEVLEHVQDDVKSVSEAWRVLKKGGVFVVFTPNSGWPFETHGVFLFGKYFWGNIPLLPWLPKFVQRAFAPHVRNYTNSDISRLFTQDSWEFVERSHVFPGFDGAVRRWGKVGSLIQRFFFAIEKTPMHWFGISHFVVVRKV